MSKADRYAERAWVGAIHHNLTPPAFEPYGGPQPAAPLDTVEWEDPPTVEHVICSGPVVMTGYAPATPEFMAALREVQS